MKSTKTHPSGIYPDYQQSSFRKCAIQYKSTETSKFQKRQIVHCARVLHEPQSCTETEPESMSTDGNYSTDGTSSTSQTSSTDGHSSAASGVPEDQPDAKVQLSAPQTPASPDSLYKMTTVLFGVLWVLSITALTTGVVLYSEEKGTMQHQMTQIRTNLTVMYGTIRPKIGFSASLRKIEQVTLGPQEQPLILVYRHTFTNVGNCYNETTGFFTAPVKGVYQFSYTAFGWSTNIPTGANLFKNGEHVTGAYDNNPGPGRGTAVTVLLELDPGDVIYLVLPAGLRVHDNTNHYNCFSGHLLFTI